MAVKFTLENDPQAYELRFDFNELADAEPVVGCNLLAAIATWPNFSAGQMRGLLFALLKPAHPQVLLPEAGGLLTRDMGAVMRAMKQTLMEAALLMVDEEAAEPKAPAVE